MIHYKRYIEESIKAKDFVINQKIIQYLTDIDLQTADFKEVDLLIYLNRLPVIYSF